MLQPLSPVLALFALLSVPSGATPQPDPIVLTADAPGIESSVSPDAVVETEQVAPMHEADHVSLEVAAFVEEEAAAGVCKQYGEICRKSRECCAPLHCAFDGYTHYCRY